MPRNRCCCSDGVDVAWRGRGGRLGQYRQIEPAWDSQNLRHLAAHIESDCFLAHVRAAPGGTIAEQNCHPFVHGGWMFQHNGEVPRFAELKRALTFDVGTEGAVRRLAARLISVCDRGPASR